MRQPGTELNVDPSRPVVPQALEKLNLSYSDQAELNAWSLSHLTAKQHRFCALKCVSFITPSADGEMTKDEENCMNTCFSKYAEGYELFQKEKEIYYANLKDLESRGIDIYNARFI